MLIGISPVAGFLILILSAVTFGVSTATEVFAQESLEESLPYDLESTVAKRTIYKNFTSVLYDVPLIPQETGYSCWAAGAAMIVSWRDGINVKPYEIANGIGYWNQYEQGLDADDTTMLKYWGLTSEVPYNWPPDEFTSLILSKGPLWVASAEPGPHIRVVTGVGGDGTYNGTIVYINDPWERGMEKFELSNTGSQYTETFLEFMQKQENLAFTEHHVPQPIYVAHLGGPFFPTP